MRKCFTSVSGVCSKTSPHATIPLPCRFCDLSLAFKMPAVVTGVSVIAHRPTDPINIRIKLVKKSGIIQKQMSSFIETANVGCNGSPVGKLYFIKIEKRWSKRTVACGNQSLWHAGCAICFSSLVQLCLFLKRINLYAISSSWRTVC